MHVDQVTPVEAQARQAAGSLLLDVREQHEWTAGHAPGAIHLPLSELGQRWEEIPEAEETIIVCRSGARSYMAAEALMRAGRSRCVNLAGGMEAWLRAGLPLSP